jgi:hypothetical protein
MGEVPGYEFEVPHGAPRGVYHGVLADSADPLRSLRRPAQVPEEPPSLGVRVGRGALAAMRARNWVTGLAVPILAAVIVGVAVVVVVGGGGGGGAAPSALDAGFPPARFAGTDFSGATVASSVVLGAIAASAGTEVVAGSADGTPAIWVSPDGGSTWGRSVLAGAAAPTSADSGELAGVAHGPAGWLAVGTALAGNRGPIVARSPDAQTWTVAVGTALLPTATGATVAAAVATGPAEYVIVGHKPAGNATTGTARAAAWYAPGGVGWRRAVIAQKVTAGGATVSGAQEMNAVTVTARGFAAVGGAGANPAAWLSATGRDWRLAPLPLPDGAVRAALTSVAASGSAVVAVGTEVSAAGGSSPFAEVSADAGASWQLAALPAPVAAAAEATVTALAATGRGFTATGTYGVARGEDVVVWTLPSAAAAAGGWTVATPQGRGLALPGTQAITALTAAGATLTGVGFAEASGVRQPTLWQSPIRD